jgi:hypothetical protein
MFVELTKKLAVNLAEDRVVTVKRLGGLNFEPRLTILDSMLTMLIDLTL